MKIKILTKCKMEIEENPDYDVSDRPFTVYPWILGKIEKKHSEKKKKINRLWELFLDC